MASTKSVMILVALCFLACNACAPKAATANAASSDGAHQAQAVSPAETSAGALPEPPAVPVAMETTHASAPETQAPAARDAATESSSTREALPSSEPGTTEIPASASQPGADVEAAQPSAAAPEPWTYERFMETVHATGRKMSMSEDAFNAIQKRKEKALKTIETYLAGKFGEADPAVLKAFEEVPREYFHYNYQGNFSTASSAYEVDAKPWGVGYGSALSDYLGQAYMTQLADPDPDDVVLEIGTGSGFQSSLLSRIVKEVYSIEIIEPLGAAVGKVVQTLGYDNVYTKVGDGYYGWPEVQGGFDAIMVTCAALKVPQPLLEQLKPGGKLIIPVGPPMRGKQVLYVYTKDEEGKIHSRRDVGVYFIPMTGAMLKQTK